MLLCFWPSSPIDISDLKADQSELSEELTESLERLPVEAQYYRVPSIQFPIVRARNWKFLQLLRENVEQVFC